MLLRQALFRLADLAPDLCGFSHDDVGFAPYDVGQFSLELFELRLHFRSPVARHPNIVLRQLVLRRGCRVEIGEIPAEELMSRREKLQVLCTMQLKDDQNSREPPKIENRKLRADADS